MRKPTRHAAVALAVTTLLVASLAACSGSPAPTGEGSKGPTTLRVYGWKGSEAAPASVPDINAAFEAAHPGVTVDYEFIDAGDSIAQRLQPELLAGTAPDVFMTTSSTMAVYQADGYLADLSGEAWASQLSDTVKPFVSIEDTIYAAPLELIPIGLFANMDLLKQAGVETFPSTWSDFTAALDALKTAGLPGLAMPNKGAYTADAIINGAASTLVYKPNPAWDADLLAGKVTFEDWRTSIDQFLSLGSNGYVDFAAALGIDEWGQGLADFKAGKSAFLYQGAWNLTDFQASVPSVEFGPWPADDSAAPWATLFSGVNWSVNADSAQLELAKEYVAFWTQSEQLTGFLKAESALSPYSGGGSGLGDAAALAAAAVADGRFRLLATASWFVQANEDRFGQDVQALMLGDIDTDELINRMNGLAAK